MERLQAAMNKARQERQQTAGGPVAGAAAPRPASGRAPGTGAAPLPVAEAWAALPPLASDEATRGRRHRIPAIGNDRATAPYDMLRARIIQQANANGWRRVAIVSPQSGSGKTTTLVNLVYSFSRQLDLSVIALDLDLRQGNLMQLMGHMPEHGMADVLEGRVPFAEHGRRIGTQTAVGLNRGPAAHPAELLHSQKTRDVIGEIEASYRPDLMLFDTAPLIGRDDTYGFLGGNVDAALLIVAANETPVEQIDLAERQLAEVTNVMGIVLNKARFFDETSSY